MSLSQRISRRFATSLRRDGFARFTSAVSYGSVAIGCIAVILAMSILEGYEQMVRSTMMRFAAPIEVRSLTNPVLDASSTALVARLRSINGIRYVEPQRSREALGRSRSGVDGIVLLGSSVSHANTHIRPMLTQGAVPSGSVHGISEATIGSGVARRLRLGPGDTLVVYASSSDQSRPVIAPLRVIGVFRSGMQQYDETAVIVNDAALATLVQMPNNQFSSVAIYPTSMQDLDVVTDRIRSLLDRRSGLYVQTYRERFAAIESWIALQRRPIPIILGLISLVAVFTVVATLLITVVEKNRQIAIFRVMGMRTRTIIGIFLWRGCTVGLVGWCIGSALSFVFCYVQDMWKPITLDGNIYYVSALPVSFSWEPYAIVAVTSLLTSVMASIIPVVIATRIQPASALRFR